MHEQCTGNLKSEKKESTRGLGRGETKGHGRERKHGRRIFASANSGPAIPTSATHATLLHYIAIHDEPTGTAKKRGSLGCILTSRYLQDGTHLTDHQMGAAVGFGGDRFDGPSKNMQTIYLRAYGHKTRRTATTY